VTQADKHAQLIEWFLDGLRRLRRAIEAVTPTAD
jgi:hypothetical protein